MSVINSLTTQHMDHLGVVAGICHRLGIADRIDDLISDNDPRRKVSPGQAVVAMIINGLGYPNRTLYMVSRFFHKKPISRLLQADIEAEHLNDDLLGRVLDKIGFFGASRLFCELAYKIGHEFNFLRPSIHLDTTSFSLEGEYKDFGLGAESIKIARGFSKDHRPDLKQVILSLCTTGPANFPLRMEALGGNVSDKESFHKTIESMLQLQKQFKWPEDMLWIADSALYNKGKLKDSEGFDWITHVPQTVKLVGTVCQEEPESGFLPYDSRDDMRYYSKVVDIDGLRQRWVIVESDQHRERKLKTFEKKLASRKKELKAKIKGLKSKEFNCVKDAEQALNEAVKKYPEFVVCHKLEEIYGYSRKGRPVQDEKPALKGYQILAELTGEAASVEQDRKALGRFVLASNVLDSEKISDEDIIREYKKQNNIEGCFRFLKDPRFLVDQIFLKDSRRIEALLMVMTLTVMVYNVGQYWLRQALSQSGETLPNQVNKQIQTPTLRWVFQLMDGVDVGLLSQEGTIQQFVLNLDEIQARIAGYFGQQTKDIYGVPG